jgi:hypothetical protein
MPSEPYQPGPTQAACPYCGTAIEGIALPATLDFAILRFHCPTCGGRWAEERDAAPIVTRYWNPAETR